MGTGGDGYETEKSMDVPGNGEKKADMDIGL